MPRVRSVSCVVPGCELAAEYVAVLAFPARGAPRRPFVPCKHVDVVVCRAHRRLVTPEYLMRDPQRIEATMASFAYEGRGRTPDLSRGLVTFARMQ